LPKRVFSIVLFGAGAERFYEGVSFLSAARARGDECLLFLRGPALKAFVDGGWIPPTEGVPPEGLHFQHKSPAVFLEELRTYGGVRVYACSAWVRLLGLDPKRVAGKVDAVVGLNAFLSQSHNGPMLNF
jgi:peroxiredoxin family protein